jgi:hypothetical protein
MVVLQSLAEERDNATSMSLNYVSMVAGSNSRAD